MKIWFLAICLLTACASQPPYLWMMSNNDGDLAMYPGPFHSSKACQESLDYLQAKDARMLSWHCKRLDWGPR